MHARESQWAITKERERIVFVFFACHGMIDFDSACNRFHMISTVPERPRSRQHESRLVGVKITPETDRVNEKVEGIITSESLLWSEDSKLAELSKYQCS